MEDYIAAYSPGFKGNEPTATAWQAARRVRIIGKKHIDVGISNVTVTMSPAHASATFTQSYTADQLRLVSRKTLHFELRDKRWVIVRESAA
jgi:ABC-type amino acid transport substrate-binding protein